MRAVVFALTVVALFTVAALATARYFGAPADLGRVSVSTLEGMTYGN